jgi:hypothetical protein
MTRHLQRTRNQRLYSDGSNRGEPQAVQVADRWHLWHNLGEAVERAVSPPGGDDGAIWDVSIAPVRT